MNAPVPPWRTALRAVLFDLDGVLLDSRRAILGALIGTLEEHGVESFSEEELLAFVGPTLQEVVQEIVQRRRLDPAAAVPLIESYRRRYARTCVEETPLYPGVGAAVHTLARHFTLAVASSKPVAFSRPILAHLGLEGCFAVIAGPSLDPGRLQTKTETVGLALRGLGLEPEAGRAPAAVMIGDRRHDVDAARDHGLPVVAVSWGFGTREELAAAAPDALVGAPEELIRLLLG